MSTSQQYRDETGALVDPSSSAPAPSTSSEQPAQPEPEPDSAEHGEAPSDGAEPNTEKGID